jgi:hypothetical protein
MRYFRYSLLAGLIITLLPLVCYSKGRHNSGAPAPQSAVLRVWISNIPSYTTTREQVLANALLVTDSVGCNVSGFTISMQAPGHDFYGPLYANGSALTDVQKDVIKKWDYPNSTLYVQDIHLNCNGQDVRAPALEYKYDH